MGSISGTVVRKAARSPVSDLEEEDEGGNEGYLRARGNSGYGGYARVVSRSGVDVMGAGTDIGLKHNRREVSGKVAEEGRAGTNSGWFRSGLWNRKPSGPS